MSPYKGETLKTSEIMDIFRREFPRFDVKFTQPPDHCINHCPKGACWCAKTEDAIFEQVKTGYYNVL